MSFEKKNLSRLLIAVLTICLIFGMSPLLPNSNTEVNAAGEETVLTVVDEGVQAKIFDAEDLDALPQVTNYYPAVNSSGNYSSYSAISGATIESILDDAGVDVASLEPTTKVTFDTTDNRPLVLEWSVLSATRYYFDNDGTQGSEVPAVIKSPSASKDAMRLFVGQIDKEDKNNSYFNKNINKIMIGEPVLTITDGKNTLKEFYAHELDALPQVTNTYSALNSRDTFDHFNYTGSTINSILNAAGINISNFDLTDNLTFISGKDAHEVSFNWSELSAKRYSFENENGGNKIEVPTIIVSPTASSDAMKFIIGQVTVSEINKSNWNDQVNKIVITSDFKLEPKIVTATLNGNGGKAPAASVKVTVGKQYGNIANATRSNYAFKGWFTTAKGGSKILPSTIVTNDKDHTLYAQWTGTNKNLKKLKATKGKLNKKFKANRTKYTLKLKKNQKSTKITATKAQSVAKVQIKVGKGKWKTAKAAKVKVAKGKSKTVKIKVTSENKSVKTYTVKVKRAK